MAVYDQANKTALIIGAFLIAGTMPYWFGGAGSSVSIVNAMLGVDSYPETDWKRFYFHFVVLLAGIAFFSGSGITRALGEWISKTPAFARYFYSDPKRAVIYANAFKLVTGVLLFFAAYFIFIKLLHADDIPRPQVSVFLLLYFFMTPFWFAGYQHILPDPRAHNYYDYRNKTRWIKLLDKQIAYVKDIRTQDTWSRVLPKTDADLSYSEVYIFDLNLFNHRLPNCKLIDTSFAKVDFMFELVSNNADSFPAKMTSSQLSFLFTLSDRSTLENLATAVIDQNLIKKELLNKYHKVHDYLQSQSHDDLHTWNQRYQDVKSIIDSVKIDHGLTHNIKRVMDAHLGADHLFKIVISVTRDTVKEDFDKHVVDHNKNLNTTASTSRIELLQKAWLTVHDAIAEQLKIAGLPPKRLKELRDILMEYHSTVPSWHFIHKYAPTLGTGTQPNPSIAAAAATLSTATATATAPVIITTMQRSAVPAFEYASAVEAITNTFYNCEAMKFDINDTQEKIINASNIFAAYNIPADDFLATLFSKYNTGKKERVKPYYRQLVEETLQLFITRK